MAMIDAYKIGVELLLGGDLAQGIEALLPGLELLDARITHANAEAKGLASSLGGVGRSATGIGRAAEAMERLMAATEGANRAADALRSGGALPEYAFPRPSRPGGGGSGAAGPRLSGGALVPSYAPNFTMPGGPEPDAPFFGERDRRGIPLNPNARPAPGERPTPPRSGPHVQGAFDDVLPMLLGGDFMLHLFGASFDVGAKESEMLQNGWTPEQVKAARTLAQSVQVGTPGASIGGSLEVLKDLGVLFRTASGAPDVEAAMKALPEYARDAIVLGGRNGGVSDLFKAAQAGDLKGALSKPGTDEIDPEKFTAFIHNVVLADRVTGGRVTPSMILQNIRTGGVAAAMMDDKDFFGANLALIEGLGPQAASALAGFNRQFGAGRMGVGVAKELEGVFPQLAGHWHSTGMGQVMVDPGAMGDPAQLAAHPFAFIRDTLMPGIDNLIRARTPGFDTMDADHRLALESQEGSRIAASVTGSRAIVEVMRLWPQMVREQLAFERAKGTDLYHTELATNPQVQTKALGAAWNAFEVSLGEAGQGPAIAALNAITGWLNDIAKWAKDNPEGGKAALEGLSLGILALGASKVKDAFSVLGVGGKGGLFGLAGGILALSGALDHMPGWLADMIKGAAAGGALGGAPGAAAGAAAGLWNHSPGGVFDMTPGEALGHLGKHLTAPYRGGQGDLPNGGDYTPMAYYPPPQQQTATIHNITYLQLDGRTIAQDVTKRQIRMMGEQVSGTLRPDPSVVPQYGSHIVEL